MYLILGTRPDTLLSVGTAIATWRNTTPPRPILLLPCPTCSCTRCLEETPSSSYILVAMVIMYLSSRGERRAALLFGMIFASLLRSTMIQAQCSVVPTSRKNCGANGITEADCKTKGCCYDMSTINTIWCFLPVYQSCDIATGGRSNCGFRGIKAEGCHNKGCCYDNTVPDTIWCFYPRVPFGCPILGDTQVRVDCPFPTGAPIIKEQCNRMKCCFDDTVAGVPFCFNAPTSVLAPVPPGCVPPPPMDKRVVCSGSHVTAQECQQDLCCFDSSSTPQCFSPVILACIVPEENRVDCGYQNIMRIGCQDRGCCFDDSIPNAIECFFAIQDVTPPGQSQTCEIGTLINNIGTLVQQWIDLTTKPQTVSTVLNTAEMFSLSTYCGLYTTAIDAVVGCANIIVRPFLGLDSSFNARFLRDLNNIDNAKGICAAVMGYSTQHKICVPASVGICSLLSFDLLVAFTKQSFNPATDINKVCDKTAEVVRGISTCIGLSTAACTPQQQNELVTVRQGYIAVANRMAQTCTSGCTDLVLFLLDRHTQCSWNLPRLYPNPNILNYCTYARNAVVCSWELWSKCRILPFEYFQKALSVMKTAFFIGGCTEFETSLVGFAFNRRFEVKLPECVSASIECAKQLSFGIGVNEMLGPYGGYNINQVKSRIYMIGAELATGNFAALCGNPGQHAANKNPIRDCMRELRAKCGPDATTEQIQIVDTAVMWFDEVCSAGCTNLADKFVNFRRTCPDMSFDYDPTTLPVQLLAALLPNGKNIALCRPIQHYASCVSRIITSCTFIHKRLQKARELLIRVVTQGRTNLPIEVFICGVKLDYPFDVSPDSIPAFYFRQAASGLVPKSWLLVLSVAILLLRQT